MAGFKDNQNKSQNFNLSKVLKTISSFGMQYDDMVFKQSQAIGSTEQSQMGSYGANSDDEWEAFAAMSMADVNVNKNVPFFDKDYLNRREELRKFAVNDEIEDILDIVCDEAVNYDENRKFAEPNIINFDPSKQVQKDIQKYYNQIYNYFGFSDGQSAWYFFRKFLVDGYLAFEIIYSEKQDEIIGFKQLDPTTLVPGYNADDGKKVWTQFKGDPNKERILYDSQIIYISYSSITTSSRVSYVERLIRSFNIMRIMEHTRIVWATTNSSFRMQFIIPVGGKSKTRAKQSLAQLMNSYKEVVDFDWDSGTLHTDGQPMMPFNKEYWMPSKEGEEPKINSIGGEGPDLSDTEALKYFSDKLKQVSKIPYSRFMYQDGGGEFQLAADGMIRDEIKFSKFINRLRSSFQEILTKPLYIQMCLKYPEFANDPQFKNQVALHFNEENVFKELKEFEIGERRLDFIEKMRESLVEEDPDTMEEEYFFDMEFLVKKYLKMSEDDLEANRKAKAKDGGDEESGENEGNDNSGGIDVNL